MKLYCHPGVARRSPNGRWMRPPRVTRSCSWIYRSASTKRRRLAINPAGKLPVLVDEDSTIAHEHHSFPLKSSI
jgi:hypothetical protein